MHFSLNGVRAELLVHLAVRRQAKAARVNLLIGIDSRA